MIYNYKFCLSSIKYLNYALIRWIWWCIDLQSEKFFEGFLFRLHSSAALTFRSFTFTQLSLFFAAFEIDKGDSLEGGLPLSSLLFEFEVFRLIYIVLGLSVLPIMESSKNSDLKQGNQKARNNSISFVVELEPQKLWLADHNEPHNGLHVEEST